MLECELFPVLVYEYDESGYHHGSVEMDEPELWQYFRCELRRILKAKTELRVTDKMDLMVFHVQDGKILYDGETHYPDGKPIPEERLDSIGE